MQLVQVRSDLAKFVSLGEEVVVVIVVDEKLAVEIGTKGRTNLSDEELQLLKALSPVSASLRSVPDKVQTNPVAFAGILIASASLAPTKQRFSKVAFLRGRKAK